MSINTTRPMLTYRQIQQMRPETMTSADREAVRQWTARANRQTRRIIWATIGIQIVHVLLLLLR